MLLEKINEENLHVSKLKFLLQRMLLGSESSGITLHLFHHR